jgi:outer membrane receptor for ferrienterochelin and colicins
MKKIFFVTIYSLSIFYAVAQNNITGIITNDAEERLPFATLQWQGSFTTATADSAGNFTIKSRRRLDTLVVTYTGYQPAKIVVEPHEKMLWVVLSGVAAMAEVVVTADRPDNFVSTLENRHVEQITSCELRKAPCCNLAGSFETNNSVDISTGNAVTGASEIQMLGLRGIYTQMTLQKRPNFYGLAYPFALEFYPGTWLNGISVSKGASSVEQGAQSLTGQINVDLVKPSEDKALFVNLYQNTLNTFEANLHVNRKLRNDWSVGVYGHYDNMQNRYDHDNDGFLNMPQKEQKNILFRALHQGKTWYSQNNLHLLQDNRVAGQVPTENNTNLWRVQQDMRRLDFSGTIGYLGLKKVYNSIAVIYGLTAHNTNELYGKNTHIGTQKSFYTNLIYATIIGNTDHRLNVGGSLQADDFKEKINTINLDRLDVMPGVFAEYAYNRTILGKKYSDWGVIIGLRNDYHNRFGNIIAPRMNVKYNFNENNIIRFSAGRGWRVANIIPENLNVLASNRAINIANNLKPEDGWNTGVNFSTRFEVLDRNVTFNADVFHTRFSNQIIADQDQDFQNIYFYNLEGKSYANSIMGVMTYNIFKNFDLKIGYKFNDVRTTIDAKLVNPPLLPRHRAMTTLDYKTPNRTWLFHLTGHFVGTQRLPNLEGLPTEYHTKHIHSGKAPSYFNLNAQITKIINNRWEIYFGGENLTNYTQHAPIIAADAPFSTYFNASQIWGPIMGIRGFAGFRYSIGQDDASQKSKISKNPHFATATFEVKGDCGMCKTRIEKTALAAGAIEAIWSSETHLLIIKFDEKRTKQSDIQAKIAKAGHDNSSFKAEKSTYDALPDCCQYTRE